jgi:hypothetical protein
MKQKENKLYGYSIIEIKIIGHGQPWWDEYYETKEYHNLKTKLFTSIEERDSKKEEEETKYRKEIEYEETMVIVPFETEMP